MKVSQNKTFDSHISQKSAAKITVQEKWADDLKIIQKRILASKSNTSMYQVLKALIILNTHPQKLPASDGFCEN